MTREEMIDEASKMALTTWRGTLAPWIRGQWQGGDTFFPIPSFIKSIRTHFTRIASREAER